MGAYVEYKEGQKLNDCYYVKEIEVKKGSPRRAIFKCNCGNIFESSISNIKHGNTRSCGYCDGRLNVDLIKPGDLIGECIFIKETPPRISKKGDKRRMALFLCMKCDNTFISRISSVFYGKTKSCGCYQVDRAIEYNTTHGYSKKKNFNRWTGMLDRCYNKSNKRYFKYGGKGVEVCDEWINDFKSYNDFIMGLPNALKRGYSIDRIDNDGNYEPSNVRWASSHTQQSNHSLHSNNTSGYKGVSFIKQHSLFRCSIGVNHKTIYLGYFHTAIDAAIARNKYIIDNNLERGYLNKINAEA